MGWKEAGEPGAGGAALISLDSLLARWLQREPCSVRCLGDQGSETRQVHTWAAFSLSLAKGLHSPALFRCPCPTGPVLSIPAGGRLCPPSPAVHMWEGYSTSLIPFLICEEGDGSSPSEACSQF